MNKIASDKFGPCGIYLCPKCAAENRYGAAMSEAEPGKAVVSLGTWKVECQECRTVWLMGVHLTDVT